MSLENGKIKQHPDASKDKSVDEAWPFFVDFLKDKSSRITQARRIVFEHVFARHDHFRADDLAAELSSGPNHVSRGTVYRTLDLMTEAGLVQKIRDQDVHAHYEHIYGHGRHHHLICEDTGEFIEFSSQKLTDEIERICAKHNFKPRLQRLVVFGDKIEEK
ncbi:MAG: transcriptional repressor [Kiritimatiellaceae bacterium]|nr:transcriptional repressor [Kiritimatiellaceae bacterium]